MRSQSSLLEEITGQQQEVYIPRWFDRHLHVRDGDMLKTVLSCTVAQGATGAVIMGNLPPPDEISTVEKAISYCQRIFDALPEGSDFVPKMTCYLTDETTPEDVVRGFEEGVWCAVKLYMADQKGQGGTTGSHRGVRNLRGRYPVFKAMAQRKIPLLGHWEAVEKEVDEFDREIKSIERDLQPILREYPDLSVVVEHITDSRAADFVAQCGHDVYATVTAHHLMINRNVMFWEGMNPVHYCKPVPKREEHRRKIRQYVTSGHHRFGAGTDSAPHDETAKSRWCRCAAGIFTAPHALELYTTVFDEDNALKNIGSFLSANLLHLYGMQPSKRMMVIKREAHTIPEKIGNVRVFRGGEMLQWKLVDW